LAVFNTQTAILANLTIHSGRTNIYEQAQAGYTNFEIINLDQSNVTIEINDGVTIELQDSTATFVPIFGGQSWNLTLALLHQAWSV
jgi:spermidine/putrescine-binding protein